MLAPSGGKIKLFMGSLPSKGVHTLKPRDTHVSEKDKLHVLLSQVG